MREIRRPPVGRAQRVVFVKDGTSWGCGAMRILSVLAAACMALTGGAAVAADLYQYSTIAALMGGAYDGSLSMARLLEQGDLGIGTVDGVDGELLVVDGKAWHVRADGKAYALAGAQETPFAVVARFAPDRVVDIPAGLDLAGLQALFDRLVPPSSAVLAIRADLPLSALTARSVKLQTPPYRPLPEVIRADQAVFSLGAITGVLVGFRFPAQAGGANVPGWHFHYLGEGKGGHVLGLTTAKGGMAGLQSLEGVRLTFLDAGEAIHDPDLELVEKGRR